MLMKDPLVPVRYHSAHIIFYAFLRQACALSKAPIFAQSI
jgi:hypothetical protein